MGGPRFLLTVLLVLLSAPAWAEEDELCAHLRAFRAAPFEKDAEGKPLRRSIELHWIGAWLDLENGFGKQCRDGGTTPGRVLCAWLPENTSTEFQANLPMDILRCYGWKIPAYAIDFDIRKGSFEIRRDEKGREVEDDDRYLLLEIDMRARKKAHTAIRLSVVPWAEKFLWPQPALKIDEPVDTESEENGP